MNAYIRKNSSPDMKITYDWKSVESGTSMAFSPSFLQISFEAVGSKKIDHQDSEIHGNKNLLTIKTDITKLEKIDSFEMTFPYKERDENNE